MREAGAAPRRRPPWSACSGAFCVWTTNCIWTRRSHWPSEAAAARIPTRWWAPCWCSDGEVVGRGWHLAPGEPHAEAMALAEAGERARGATLYCTLEPCSHHGKTPPCADALVAAGVESRGDRPRRPEPQVDGRGLRKLRDGGVEVDLAEDRWGARAREQNAPFLTYHRTGRPLVTYKAAVTLDGKVAAAGGDARWISCLDSRRAVHELRSRGGRGHGRRRHGAPRRPELTVRLADGRDPCAWSSRTTAPCRRAPGCWRRRARRAPSWSPTRRRGRAPAPGGARRRAASKWGRAACRPRLEALAGLGLLDVLCEGGPTLAGELLAGGPDRPRAAVRRAAHRRARRARPVRGARRLRGRRRVAPAGTCSGAPSATTCCSAAPSCARGD